MWNYTVLDSFFVQAVSPPRELIGIKRTAAVALTPSLSAARVLNNVFAFFFMLGTKQAQGCMHVPTLNLYKVLR
jgi:hypothetical protein